MSDPRPHETGRDVRIEAIDWLEQFLKQFQFIFMERGSELTQDAGVRAFQCAAIRTFLDTLEDSGMGEGELIDLLSDILVERKPAASEWSDEMNARRFALIDKDIQDGLTIAEQIELASLTNLMRRGIDTEANVPMDGAKALHKKLLEMKSADSSP